MGTCAEKIYNIAVVLDYFCRTQQEIEELKKSVSFLMSKLGDDSNG